MLPAWISPLAFFALLLAWLLGSQVFWFRRARSLVSRCRPGWPRLWLAVPLLGWFYLLAALLLLFGLRLHLDVNIPVLTSFFRVAFHSAVMLPVGFWITASAVSFLLVQVVRGAAALSSGLRVRLRPAKSSEMLPDSVCVDRRYFLQVATYAAGALPFVMASYGFLIGRQNYRVFEPTLRIPNLPEGLDGLRILQLTDVHASAYMPIKEVRRVAGMASELGADLVFHTGDFITSRGDPLDESVAELARVRGRYASFGCLGNHEIYADVEDYTAELFHRAGVRILRGENAQLEVRGARLNVIGVDYQRHRRGLGPERSKKYFLVGVEKLVRSDAFNILLTHNPNPFVRAAELGIALSLAGHTHGGQVQVEILNRRWAPARFITPFVAGLYLHPSGAGSSSRVAGLGPAHRSPGPPAGEAGSDRDEGGSPATAFLYVSRGIGTIAAPIRLNVPPEITLLTLRRA
jgi:predicted MPP superfamily phosphohydrolase